MKNILLFKNDVFFKYCFGRNTIESMLLRSFLLDHILEKKMKDVRVDNPHLFVVKDGDKVIELDIFMSHDTLRAGMEMQQSLLSPFLRKRFQYYAFKAVVSQMMNGEKDYSQLKEYHQIIFIDDENLHHPSLINHASIRYEDGEEMNECIVHIHFINMKYVRRLSQEKEILSEFEAMIYLIAQNNINHLKYENKKGMIEIMERMRESFQQNKELMSVMITEEEKRKLRQMELEMEKEEGVKEGEKIGIDKGKAIGIEEGENIGTVKTINTFIGLKYQRDASQWLRGCTSQQLEHIQRLLLTDISYKDLLEQVDQML